ncbi:MAG: DUF835 domain-containing protein [Candidatus Methanoperedens sp.]|nr:DUF835 domain-containing protein [Candidatus Methanoperedens sp.]
MTSRKNKPFKDIISKESVLISFPFSPSTEEQLYRAVYESIGGTEIKNIIWVCYQQPPDTVKNKLIFHSLIFPQIQFIDMITQIMGLAPGNEETKYCISPTEYNCLFKSIDELIEKNGRSVIIMDNLNAMMSYDTLERIIKTLRSLNNRITQSKSVILYLETTGACGIQTAVAVRSTMNYVLDFNEGGNDKKDIEWERLKKASWKDVLTINTPILSVMVMVMFLTVIFLVALLLSILVTR